ncbi:MAG: TetR/AcrR family transcriptional regulator [Thalassospira sp.]|uniref:TetR/AcrR family transcriptional regulator n=1 Tax=Thalassospira sp. TaxID=1912094 RepID=UPI0032EF68CD
MARPQKFDRTEAVKAAMETIWKDGYEHSSVKHLSEVLGMTRSSFYNAFGSREALFRETMEPYSAQAPAARLVAEGEAPILPLIAEVVRDTCCRICADPDGRGCMIQNTVNALCPDKTNEGLGADLADTVLSAIGLIEGLLVTAKERGELPESANSRVLALAVQNLLMGLNTLGKVVRDPDDLWQLAGATLEGLGLTPQSKKT